VLVVVVARRADTGTAATSIRVPGGSPAAGGGSAQTTRNCCVFLLHRLPVRRPLSMFLGSARVGFFLLGGAHGALSRRRHLLGHTRR